MRTEFPPVNTPLKTRPLRTRRTTGDRVREALLELAEGHATPISHNEQAWASITFAGTRHEFVLQFDSPEAIEAGEQLIAALPDHEFTIPGQLVAEASVNSVDHTMHPAPNLVVKLTLLLLEEA